MEIMMQTGQKLLIGISIVVGVICIELSMYVIPFIEEVKEFEFPMFVVGVILCIISISEKGMAWIAFKKDTKDIPKGETFRNENSLC